MRVARPFCLGHHRREQCLLGYCLKEYDFDNGRPRSSSLASLLESQEYLSLLRRILPSSRSAH